MLDQLSHTFKRIYFPLFILLIVLLSISITGCEKKIEVVKPIRSVKFVEMKSKEIDRVRKFSGITEAGTESKLSFKIPGSVIYRVNVGDNVLKGQAIAKIDPETYLLQVEEAKASLEEEKAKQINAYSFYDKIRALYVNGNAAKADLESARSRYESSKAKMKVINKRIEIAKLNLSYTTLRAPASGSIAATYTEINENVSAGVPIALLLYGSEKKVKVTLPETLIFKVKKGEKVLINFDAIPDKVFEGVVSEISSATTDNSTTYPVTIDIIGIDNNIKSGMSAEVAFSFDTSQIEKVSKVFIVPSISVNKDNKTNYVYVVEEKKDGKGVIKRKDIIIGDLVREGIQVLSGLKSGDKVIVAGVSKINDGDIVKVENIEQ